MTENTLRDQFAMAALTGLLAGGQSGGDDPVTAFTEAAYRYADRMVSQRQKPKANEGAEK